MQGSFGSTAEHTTACEVVDAIHAGGRPHILRAIQEGIAFSFRYGIDIMRDLGLKPDLKL